MRYEYGTSPRKYEYTPETKRKPKTRSKTQSRKVVKKKATFPKYVYVFSALIISFAFIVSIRGSKIEERNLQIQQDKRAVEQLKNDNAQLKIDLQKALSLTNVEKQAKEKLGMRELQSHQIRYVKLDKQDYIEPVIITRVEEKKTPLYKKVLNLFTGTKDIK